MVRPTKKIDVTVDFFKFIRKKKAEKPDKYRTNYDVFDEMIEKFDRPLPFGLEPERPKKKKSDFWGKI